MGHLEGWPNGPIQSLNLLHHAALMGDPWQHMEANAGHHSFWAASCLSAPENLSAQQDVSLCAHHPPAPGPLLLACPKVHSLGLKSRIWSGEGITLTTFLLLLLDNERKEIWEHSKYCIVSYNWACYIKDLLYTETLRHKKKTLLTLTSQLAQPQWPSEVEDTASTN